MNRRCIRAFVMLALVTGVVRADLIQSTWDFSGGDPAWTNPDHWEHSDPNVTSFPDNGNEGHTFEVTIDGAVTIGQNIDIESLLFLSGGGLTGGAELTVNQTSTFEGPTGGFTGTGTFTAAGPITVPGTMNVTGWTVDAGGQITVGELLLAGRINLNERAELNLAGLEFVYDGDISVGGSNTDLPVIRTQGSRVAKTGADGPQGTSEIKGRFEADGGLIECTAGVLQFPTAVGNASWSIDFDGTRLKADGGTIVVARDADLSAVAIECLNDSDIIFSGLNADFTLNGTMTSNGLGQFIVSGGSTSFDGGTLNFSPDVPFFLDGAEMGFNEAVQNTGAFGWCSGTIGGLVNRAEGEDTAGTEQGQGDRVIAGVLENAVGAVFNVQNTIKIDENGTLRNRGRLALPASGVRITPLGQAENTMFENTGTIEFPDDAQVFVTVSSAFTDTQGTISFSLAGDELTMSGFTELNGTTISSRGSLKLDGDSRLSGNVSLEGGARFILYSGEHELTGTVRATEMGLEVFGVAGATLRGSGTVDIGDGVNTQTGFALETGTVDGPTNRGGFFWTVGTVRNFTNAGTTVVRQGGTKSVRGGPFRNDSTVRQAHTISVASDGVIANAGVWTVEGAWSIAQLDDVPGRVDNTGVLRKQDAGTALIRARFDNTGTVACSAGELNFGVDQVVQFDSATGILNGGTWLAGGTGTITILSSDQPLREIGPAADVTVLQDGKITGLRLDVVAGTLTAGCGAMVVIEDIIDIRGELEDGECTLLQGEPTIVTVPGANSTGTVTVWSGSILEATDFFLQTDGLLRGGGTVISALVDVSGGALAPGIVEPDRDIDDPTDVLTVEGDVALFGDGVLAIDAEGTTPGAGGHDQLVVTGSVELGGTLDLTTLEGYEPKVDDAFDVVVAASVTGDFDATMLPFGFEAQVLADRVRVVVVTTVIGDLDGDGLVTFADLLILLASWGGPGGDLNGDGFTDFDDLLILLTNWSPA